MIINGKWKGQARHDCSNDEMDWFYLGRHMMRTHPVELDAIYLWAKPVVPNVMVTEYKTKIDTL